MIRNGKNIKSKHLSIVADLSDYSKPYNFMLQSIYVVRIMNILWPVLLLSTLYVAIFIIEQDMQQGENYKIMYIHVPSAWISLLNYTFIAVLSVIYLISQHPIAYIFSKAMAKLGVVFTFITLITGSLWGLPVWGTFWVWDGRLTSMLLLFFLYVSYLLFSSSFSDKKDNAKLSSILAIVGIINIPIIKYSVEWWNTLHQPSTFSQVNSSMDIMMVIPLILIFISLFIFCFTKCLMLVRSEIIERKTASIDLYSNIENQKYFL